MGKTFFCQNMPDLDSFKYNVLIHFSVWMVKKKILSIQVQSLRVNISFIKNWVAEILGKPSSTLSIYVAEIGYLRDEKTLAFYNIHPNTKLILSCCKKSK